MVPADQHNVQELEQMANSDTVEDEAFLAFKERISHDPDQVLLF